MPETNALRSGHETSFVPPASPHRIRSRIGTDLAGGFYPAPHRYEVYLSPGCPNSLRVTITLALLRLSDSIATTLIASPGATSDATASLRRAYEATWHHYDGPLTVPALCDRWSGRVVSNHTPDILRDLAVRLADPGEPSRPRLRPAALAADIDAVHAFLADLPAALAPLDAALAPLDARLASGPFVLGGELTAADVDLWVALVYLDDRDADAAPLAARYPRLAGYVRRLRSHPAFHRGLALAAGQGGR
ncbi:glutathione S-transferase C-terminal domain-containing protein [Streptomyces sp. MK37H]|uniref:glutathione S-transferase C-terminal domain-containing protein n=1 Tax=Streptomyces sp. MK37H TaxID=2699117 RepID=UPI001B3974B5|nr:glutathione S-transferase C-terminal domain-containing protein [Streptomyces sp. MK37H]MBP8534609.1 cell envelope biogenesis protein OmpA [Streptomyces sp. MK37H]